jgi:hypothetical protein
MKNLGNWLGAVALLGLCACASGRTSTATMAPPGSATVPASTTAPAATPDSTAAAQKADCSAVRCAACPEGQAPALKPPDCCRCVPTNGQTQPTDCSAARCAGCPEGEHPALTLPDCCKCVPGMKGAALPF